MRTGWGVARLGLCAGIAGGCGFLTYGGRVTIGATIGIGVKSSRIFRVGNFTLVLNIESSMLFHSSQLCLPETLLFSMISRLAFVSKLHGSSTFSIKVISI